MVEFPSWTPTCSAARCCVEGCAAESCRVAARCEVQCKFLKPGARVPVGESGLSRPHLWTSAHLQFQSFGLEFHYPPLLTGTQEQAVVGLIELRIVVRRAGTTLARRLREEGRRTTWDCGGSPGVEWESGIKIQTVGVYNRPMTNLQKSTLKYQPSRKDRQERK